MLDFEFWVNFRQEDRICRMGGEEKAETGDWRPERKGRATGEGRGDFGRWILDWRSSYALLREGPSGSSFLAREMCSAFGAEFIQQSFQMGS